MSRRKKILVIVIGIVVCVFVLGLLGSLLEEDHEKAVTEISTSPEKGSISLSESQLREVEAWREKARSEGHEITLSDEELWQAIQEGKKIEKEVEEKVEKEFKRLRALGVEGRSKLIREDLRRGASFTTTFTGVTIVLEGGFRHEDSRLVWANDVQRLILKFDNGRGITWEYPVDGWEIRAGRLVCPPLTPEDREFINSGEKVVVYEKGVEFVVKRSN